MEIDPKKISRLSRRKERENQRFRYFLKSGSIHDDQIDSTINELYREISSVIECRECANCCIEMEPMLDQNDIKRLSGGLGIDVKEIKEKYLIDGEEPGSFTFNARPCPFLKDRSCTVYPHRPKECRSYPHLHCEGMSHRSTYMIHNSAICPIVYNVLEEFKIRYNLH